MYLAYPQVRYITVDSLEYPPHSLNRARGDSHSSGTFVVARDCKMLMGLPLEPVESVSVEPLSVYGTFLY